MTSPFGLAFCSFWHYNNTHIGKSKIPKTRDKLYLFDIVNPLGNLWINRLRLVGESFAQSVQFWKREIHTVFLRFQNFRLSQNLLPPVLADLIRGSLAILCANILLAVKCLLLPHPISSPKEQLPFPSGSGPDCECRWELNSATKNPNPLPMGNKFGFFLYGGRYRTRLQYGVGVVQPPPSDTPPACRI